MDGWTASVCTQLDQQQTFLGWTHKNGKKTITDQQGNLLDTNKGQGRNKRGNRLGGEAKAL